MQTPKDLYLDLMKRALTNWIYGEAEAQTLSPKKNPLKRQIVSLLSGRGLKVMKAQPVDFRRREEGSDRSPIAHTMVGLKRLDNIQYCVEDALENNVPGDLIETGVWRGGATIFMRAILKARGVTDRSVWVADSFEGCPRPDAGKYPCDKGDDLHTAKELAISLEQVKENFRRYDLLDNQVKFLKGWFKDTLPKAPIQNIAVMRLDGDLYESTIDALTHLYPKLSPGGYVIIDDYGAIPACRRAVEAFRDIRNIKDKITKVDWTGAFWRRT